MRAWLGRILLDSRRRTQIAARLLGELLRFKVDTWAAKRRFGEHVRIVKPENSMRDADRWQVKQEGDPRLTIVIVSYQQELALDCLLKSLMCQTLQNFKVLVIHDGPNANTKKIVNKYSAVCEYLETEKRFNDYGHSLREIGIQKTDTEFILLTNGDNYYAPRFTEFMFEAIDRQRLDLVFCDMVHSHRNPGFYARPSYKFFRTRPFVNYIDVGCFITKSAMSKKVGFRDRSFTGDATYFEDLLRRPVRVGKVEKILMVHN